MLLSQRFPSKLHVLFSQLPPAAASRCIANRAAAAGRLGYRRMAFLNKAECCFRPPPRPRPLPRPPVSYSMYTCVSTQGSSCLCELLSKAALVNNQAATYTAFEQGCVGDRRLT